MGFDTGLRLYAAASRLAAQMQERGIRGHVGRAFNRLYVNLERRADLSKAVIYFGGGKIDGFEVVIQYVGKAKPAFSALTA